MSRFFFHDRRFFLFADFHTFGASGVERTAFRRIHCAGNVAFKNEFGRMFLVKGKSRNRSKQRFGIGVEGVMEKNFGICDFAKVSEIHNKDSVAEMFYNTKVVGYEEISKFFFLTELIEKLKDLCLNGNVKGGNRFVKNNEFGIESDCSCNSDTLFLAAGKCVRIGIIMLAFKTDFFKKIHCFFLAELCGIIGVDFINFLDG